MRIRNTGHGDGISLLDNSGPHVPLSQLAVLNHRGTTKASLPCPGAEACDFARPSATSKGCAIHVYFTQELPAYFTGLEESH